LKFIVSIPYIVLICSFWVEELDRILLGFWLGILAYQGNESLEWTMLGGAGGGNLL